MQIGFPTSFLVRFRLSPLLSPLSRPERPERPDLLSDFASQLFVNKQKLERAKLEITTKLRYYFLKKTLAQ